MTTFQQLCGGARCSPDEQEKLAWHLSQLRARRTYEELKSCPLFEPIAAPVPGAKNTPQSTRSRATSAQTVRTTGAKDQK